MEDNVPGEAQEPEKESTLEHFDTGRIVSAIIYAPDSSQEGITLYVNNWPSLKAPGYCAVSLEAVKIVDETHDDDGEDLFWVRPVISNMERTPEEVLGKCFLVTREQLFPVDDTVLLSCILEGMDLLYHHGGTREELLTGIRSLLCEAGCDPENT